MIQPRKQSIYHWLTHKNQIVPSTPIKLVSSRQIQWSLVCQWRETTHCSTPMHRSILIQVGITMMNQSARKINHGHWISGIQPTNQLANGVTEPPRSNTSAESPDIQNADESIATQQQTSKTNDIQGTRQSHLMTWATRAQNERYRVCLSPMKDL